MICSKHLLLRHATKAQVIVCVPGDTVVVRYQAGPCGYRLLPQGDYTADQQGNWRASSRDTTTSNRNKTISNCV